MQFVVGWERMNAKLVRVAFLFLLLSAIFADAAVGTTDNKKSKERLNDKDALDMLFPNAEARSIRPHWCPDYYPYTCIDPCTPGRCQRDEECVSKKDFFVKGCPEFCNIFAFCKPKNCPVFRCIDPCPEGTCQDDEQCVTKKVFAAPGCPSFCLVFDRCEPQKKNKKKNKKNNNKKNKKNKTTNPQQCGKVICPKGQRCCNPLCSTCTPPGVFCTLGSCQDPPPEPCPPLDCPSTCTAGTCAAGQICVALPSLPSPNGCPSCSSSQCIPCPVPWCRDPCSENPCEEGEMCVAQHTFTKDGCPSCEKATCTQNR